MIDENGLALTTLRTDARTDLATTKLYRNVTTILSPPWAKGYLVGRVRTVCRYW